MSPTFGEIIRNHNVKLKKRLGQHFITDPGLLTSIAGWFVPDKTWVVLELGAGMGTLTRVLCEKAHFVYAVEIDEDLREAVNELTSGIPNLHWIWGDALGVDLTGQELARQHPQNHLLLCGNLPYYITSEVLYRALIPRSFFSRMAFLVQQEVALRMKGSPGTRSFGRLALWCQYRANVVLGRTLPKGAFLPNPEVTSRLVLLDMRRDFPLSVEEENLLDRLSRVVFGQRRKTLANGLRMFAELNGVEWRSFITVAENEGLDVSQRPEDLSVDQFVSLVRAVFPLLH